jgi:hypothetical protein
MSQARIWRTRDRLEPCPCIQDDGTTFFDCNTLDSYKSQTYAIFEPIDVEET